jgi:hypothetical protein
MLGIGMGLTLSGTPGIHTAPTGFAMWAQVSTLTNGTVSSFVTTGTNPPTFTQATGADQPVKSGPSPSIITFDGVNDIVLASTPTNVVTGAFTVGLKFKFNTVPTNIFNYQVILEILSSASSGAGPFFAAIPDPSWHNISISGLCASGTVGFNPTLDTSAHRLIFTYDGVGAANLPSAYQLYYDGVSQTLAAGGGLSGALPGGNGKNCMGALENDTQPFNGALYDVLVYPSVLSAGNITSLDSFLQSL